MFLRKLAIALLLILAPFTAWAQTVPVTARNGDTVQVTAEGTSLGTCLIINITPQGGVSPQQPFPPVGCDTLTTPFANTAAVVAWIEKSRPQLNDQLAAYYTPSSSSPIQQIKTTMAISYKLVVGSDGSVQMLLTQ